MIKKLRVLIKFKKIYKKSLKDFVFRKLLKNNNFICLNYENVNYFNMNDNYNMIMLKQFDYNRFYNILLNKKIAIIFYNNERISLKH